MSDRLAPAPLYSGISDTVEGAMAAINAERTRFYDLTLDGLGGAYVTNEDGDTWEIPDGMWDHFNAARMIRAEVGDGPVSIIAGTERFFVQYGPKLGGKDPKRIPWPPDRVAPKPPPDEDENKRRKWKFTPKQFRDQVGDAKRRKNNPLRDKRGRISTKGLSPLQEKVVGILLEERYVATSDISNELGVSPGVLSRTIGSLAKRRIVKKGWAPKAGWAIVSLY